MRYEWAGSLARLGHLLDVQPKLDSVVIFEKNLEKSFSEFLSVDLCRGKRTVEEKLYYLRRFLEWLRAEGFREVDNETVRSYLKSLDASKTATYINTLKFLRVFFKQFLRRPEIVQSFQFPRQSFKPRTVYSREQLLAFYNVIDSDIGRALFLMYASTGLRKNEVLTLKRGEVDAENRMVMPSCHSGRTKQSYVSFYNAEAERLLDQLEPKTEKLFPISDKQFRRIWNEAKARTGLNITAQRLREWFCDEMSRLGVADRYIDAFCGRTPKSVLAKHYSDYSPEKLKAIYEKANLKILT